MHHIEYIVAPGAALDQTFPAAILALEGMGFRSARDGARGPSLDGWPGGGDARLRLPRGFDRGDEVAVRLSTSLSTRVLRLYASAGATWGYDAYSAVAVQVCAFRSDHPRRGDEATALALWAGRGRDAVKAIARVLDPAYGPDGPAAVQALADALGVPYPTEPPARRAILVREGQ